MEHTSTLSTPPLTAANLSTPGSDAQLADLSSRMCNTILNALCLLGIPALLGSLSRILDFGLSPVMVIQILALSAITFVTLKKHRLSYAFRVGALLTSIYVLAIAGLWSFGHLGGGKLMLLVFIVLTALFADTKYAYASIGLSALSLLVFGWVFVSGGMNVSATSDDYNQSPATWITAVLTIVMLGGFISSAVARILSFQRNLLLSLETQASYNATLIEQAAACMLVVDNNYFLRDANTDAQALLVTGTSTHWHRPLSELIVPGPGTERLLASLKTALLGESVTNLEIQMTGNNKQHLDFVWNMAPHRNAEGDAIGVICVGQNITELKHAQQQLIHSSRLTTLGEMTTSIAHEINQPLAIIRLLVQNLLKKISLGVAQGQPINSELVQSKLERIDQQIERAAEITDHMRLFGNTEQGPQTQIVVQSVIENALSLTAEQFRLQNIVLVYEKPDQDIVVSGRKLELEQAILQVLNNAEYAVNTFKPSAHKQIAISLSGDAAGAKIEISDSGAGISTHTLPYLFDPFFTTKETGEGTGLGLSVTYKLLTDMGASISAANSPRGGARFTIQFPPINEG